MRPLLGTLAALVTLPLGALPAAVSRAAAPPATYRALRVNTRP